MQVTIIGRDNKGEVVFDKEYGEVQQHGIGNMIADMHYAYPTAIHVAMSIAYPDPEVLAIKAKIKTVIADEYKNLSSVVLINMANALFDTFNIKER